MKRLIMFLLVLVLLVSMMVSCRKCPKCEPVVKTRFVVPEFACPVPDDPVIIPMPNDALVCFSLSEQTDREACEKKKMENIGTNITSYRNVLNQWKNIYKWCIEHTVELYKKASDAVNIENDAIEESISK